MPKQVRVETPEAFYKSQQQSKKSMWDCLMDIGTDWTFEPGVDFAKGATPRSLIDRLKGWLRNQGHDYKVLRNVGKNGAVTIRLAEWTQEEREVRDKRATAQRRGWAAKRLREKQDQG